MTYGKALLVACVLALTAGGFYLNAATKAIREAQEAS